ncbi:MAG: single-stranded DNA-binding protein [Firmicutes bacterium]|nr:single-stranded DNA-binding protein [Bacillota bacterium]
MNKVFLTGRFTRDPESRMGVNSLEVARFSLACQNDFVSKTGERDVEFINCVAFGKTAQTINKFCKKGQQICAAGRIKNNSYDAQDGTKRYTTDIIVDQFEFLGAKGNTATDSNYSMDNNMSYESANIETTDVSEDPYKDFGEEVNISSDDLPF